MKPFMMIPLAVLAALTAPAPALYAAADDALTVAAIRLGVTDLDESVAFYTKHLGCTSAGDFSADGFAMLENNGVYLVFTKVAEPVAIADDQCHARANFAVADLEEKTTAMKQAGVKFVGAGTSGVGRYETFVDPSGNRHNLKQLDAAAAQAAGLTPDVATALRIYDVGISVTDMKQAEAFYADILGFEVMTRDYYPPVIPITQRGSTFFILSETAKKPAPYDYASTAFTGLALETGDLPATLKRLREKGVAFIDESPRLAGNVLHAAFRDPFGNVHEIISHTAVAQAAPPARESAPEVKPASAALASLDWLAGAWVIEREGAYLEETWSVPRGDSMAGMFRWLRGKTGEEDAWMCELMTIQQEGEKVLFRLRHFDRKLTPWEKEEPLTYTLERTGEKEVVFRNPDPGAGHPHRFIYRRADDKLTVRLENADGTGDEFTFTRAGD